MLGCPACWQHTYLSAVPLIPYVSQSTITEGISLKRLNQSEFQLCESKQRQILIQPHHSYSLSFFFFFFFGKHSQNPSGTFKTGLTTTQTIDLILVWKYTCCLKVLFLDWRKFHQFKVHPAAWKNHCLLLCSSISSPTSSLCPSPLQTPACYSAMCPAVFMLLSTPHVWPGWLASASVPSLILKLNPAAGSSSLLPCLPSSTLCWAELANLCELSVEPSEHRQRELLSPLYLFLSIVISHQTNACAHTVLRCAGLSIFFSAVQSRVLT